MVEGVSPFEVAVGDVAGFVESAEFGECGLVEVFLPAFAFAFAEVDAAAHGSVLAGVAEVVELVGAAVLADGGGELGEGDE